MSGYIRDNIFNIKTDQEDANALHAEIISGVRLKGAPLIILFCAIIIASIGLITNSTAVIIGAMLISPLMSPIVAMGYSIATYDGKLLKKGALNFSIQIMIALVGATLFFSLSPITSPTSELLARTGPSFFDMLIAFFGGAAGIIGISRKTKTNVIPGVAIATALMPPICTVGYGIANGNPNYIFPAAYLFAINAFFILVATFAFCKLLQLKQAEVVKERFNKIVKRGIIIGVILISLPLLVSAGYVGTATYNQTALTSNVENFINNEVDTDSTIVMKASVFEEEQRMRLDLIGEKYDPSKIAEIQSSMADYGLGDYSLEVIQDIETSLFAYFQNSNNQGIIENRIVIH
ncbi:DUF389 domain-containing protein [Acetobacterium bakii]|uniref:DUF389 domain-containing protein n=1 Tax=Acetobacterium bakii TaxID=52689 RepID=UPI00067FFE1F|nr:DUF389 domain-containing protein [Acetobacterium bakii]